jgi:intracellular sulfur oxidation DsrE/DsrF family protein
MTKDRRSFLTQLGAGVTVAGAALGSGAPLANARSFAAFRPASHTQDDWMDKIPGKHRLVFDTTTPAGFGAALAYANNYLTASQTGYGLTDQDAAIIIVARHFSTPYAYSDAMWAKYGKTMPPMIKLEDPKTKQPSDVNLYATPGYQGSNLGVATPEVLKRGVHFAVCQMATQFFAGMMAQQAGSTADAVYKELSSNLVSNSHLAPAGIVAVNRAQERGFTLVTPL